MKTTVSATLLPTLHRRPSTLGTCAAFSQAEINVNKGLLQPAHECVACESTCAGSCGNLSLSAKLFNHRSTFQLRSLSFLLLRGEHTTGCRSARRIISSYSCGPIGTPPPPHRSHDSPTRAFLSDTKTVGGCESDSRWLAGKPWK